MHIFIRFLSVTSYHVWNWKWIVFMLCLESMKWNLIWIFNNLWLLSYCFQIFLDPKLKFNAATLCSVLSRFCFVEYILRLSRQLSFLMHAHKEKLLSSHFAKIQPTKTALIDSSKSKLHKFWIPSLGIFGLFL